MPVSSMKLASNFPVLRIVPIDALVPHEYHDTTRSIALKRRLMADGILNNPPLVAPLQGDLEKYMLLDGANRTNALKMMNVPHILVQIVSPAVSGFELSTWNQVVLGISPVELLSNIEDVSGISLEKNPNTGSKKGGLGSSQLFKLHLATNQVYYGTTQRTDPRSRIQALQIILARVGQSARLDRSHLADLHALQDLYPDLAGLIVFPCFEFGEIVQLADNGQLIPAGITRFSVSPRALRVNFKIDALRSELPLIEKNDLLANWIQERVSQKGLRVYNETTILFDE